MDAMTKPEPEVSWGFIGVVRATAATDNSLTVTFEAGEFDFDLPAILKALRKSGQLAGVTIEPITPSG